MSENETEVTEAEKMIASLAFFVQDMVNESLHYELRHLNAKEASIMASALASVKANREYAKSLTLTNSDGEIFELVFRALGESCWQDIEECRKHVRAQIEEQQEHANALLDDVAVLTALQKQIDKLRSDPRWINGPMRSKADRNVSVDASKVESALKSEDGVVDEEIFNTLRQMQK